MLDLKPYGAFIEYTIRPLLEEFKWVLKELEKSGLKITEGNLGRSFTMLAKLHFRSLFMNLIRDVTVTLIIGFVAYKILGK